MILKTSPGLRMVKYFAFAAFQEYDRNWIIEIPGKIEGNKYNWTEDPKVITTMHWRDRWCWRAGKW